MLARLALALVLLFVTAAPAAAEGLEDVATEAEHMVGDVAKAKTAQPAEARALPPRPSRRPRATPRCPRAAWRR